MTVRSEANAAARRLYRSASCRSAYVAGALAAAGGKAITDCPHRVEERVTWRTSLRRAWERGYDSVLDSVE